MDFTGKVAIVTGAGKGIGAEIAKLLAALGASTFLVDVDSDAVDRTASEISNNNGNNNGNNNNGNNNNGHSVGIRTGDVGDKKFVSSCIESVLKEKNKIDILINNAGIIRDNLLKDISEDDWDIVLNVNLKAPFLMCQAVFPTMKERNYGKIVNIISRSWLGNIGQANYSASKGGLVSLTRTLALELARFQINVNGVAPGLIDTPLTRGLSEKARDRLIQMQPTKKMGTTKDVAHAVAFLASDNAAFITGQILHVDGGKSCGLLSL